MTKFKVPYLLYPIIIGVATGYLVSAISGSIFIAPKPLPVPRIKKVEKENINYDKAAEDIINKNILSKIVRIFGIKLAEKSHSRGIGLYVNRSVLRKVGGDIKLLDTSETGTKFVIIIPIIPLVEN